MPIVGERVWSLWAWSINEEYYTATWDFRFPPAPKLVKVFLSLHSVYDGGRASPFLQSIRKRLPDGTDQQIDFHDPYHFNDYIQVYSDSALSGFVAGMIVSNSWANIMIVEERW